MISNLASARALIQADLDHARSVLVLWTDQVSELEKALEQINLVDDSKTALLGANHGQKASASALALAAGNGANGKARRGRKPKQVTAVQPDRKLKKQRTAKSASTSVKSNTAEDSPRTAKRSPRGTAPQMKKTKPVPGVAKYRDPNSNKTWTGHGRRPGWMVGAPEQYAIDDQAGRQGTPAGKTSETDTAAIADASA